MTTKFRISEDIRAGTHTGRPIRLEPGAAPDMTSSQATRRPGPGTFGAIRLSPGESNECFLLGPAGLPPPLTAIPPSGPPTGWTGRQASGRLGLVRLCAFLRL